MSIAPGEANFLEIGIPDMLLTSERYMQRLTKHLSIARLHIWRIRNS